jgi:hypothetical protein
MSVALRVLLYRERIRFALIKVKLFQNKIRLLDGI